MGVNALGNRLAPRHVPPRRLTPGTNARPYQVFQGRNNFGAKPLALAGVLEGNAVTREIAHERLCPALLEHLILTAPDAPFVAAAAALQFVRFLQHALYCWFLGHRVRRL